MTSENKVELLAPAGNPEKLEIAIHYGADAVYLAGKDFSLRNLSENFTLEELEKAVRRAHENRVKVYVAVNVFPRTAEEPALRSYLESLRDIGPDALIVADPGVFMMARRILPGTALHISTQANTTHVGAVRFWKSLGARRINAARELSLEEIRMMTGILGVEIEAFVHGAMCISYSGRCLLSSFIAHRDGNRGVCCQPCRSPFFLIEGSRPEHPFPIEEDGRGAYILNAKDLCMIDHLPTLIAAGVTSLKIEGRMKGIHYLGTVVRTYRTALDDALNHPANPRTEPEWMKELGHINQRGYCTGFYFGAPSETRPAYEGIQSNAGHPFVGKILEVGRDGRMRLDVRNKIAAGDAVEILLPGQPLVTDFIRAMADEFGAPVETAQPNTAVWITMDDTYGPLNLLRKRPSAIPS